MNMVIRTMTTGTQMVSKNDRDLTMIIWMNPKDLEDFNDSLEKYSRDLNNSDTYLHKNGLTFYFTPKIKAVLINLHTDY